MSQPVAFATPATFPNAPQAPTLGGKGRTNLTVGICLLDLEFAHGKDH